MPVDSLNGPLLVTVDGGIAPSTPGSRAGLLPPSPLRTARASFPSSSSSLANAPCGTRSCHVQHMRWHDLHHTRLEPPHRHPVGECTSQCRHCRHLLSLLKRLAKVSGEARPDGRQRACAWGDVAIGSTPIHSITEWPSLLPSSHARTPIGLPCGSLSLAGGVRGCHVPSQSHTNGVGALCPPVACGAHDKEAESPCTRYSALLAQAFQHLWLVFFDDVYQAFTWVGTGSV